MIVELLTEHHLEFLSLKGGCPGSSESTLDKMSHCWKSHVAAQKSVAVRKTVYGIFNLSWLCANKSVRLRVFTNNIESICGANNTDLV